MGGSAESFPKICIVSMGYTHKAFGNILTEQAGKDALGLRFFPLTPLSRDKLVLHDNMDILPMLLIPRAVLCGGRRKEAAGSVPSCCKAASSAACSVTQGVTSTARPAAVAQSLRNGLTAFRE